MQYHSRALRHHREAAALEQNRRAEAVLELEKLADPALDLLELALVGLEGIQNSAHRFRGLSVHFLQVM